MSAAPQPTYPATGYPTTGYPMTGYPMTGYQMPMTGYQMPATTGYPMSYQPQYEQMTDRQVYTEQVTVPQQVTVNVPQTTYQARTVQVPQVQQVRVPRQTFETQTNYIQVPKYEIERKPREVTKTVMVPQTTTEIVYDEIKKPMYVQKTRKVQVPRTTYEEVDVPYQEQVMEQQAQTIQVPRMTEEIQNAALPAPTTTGCAGKQTRRPSRAESTASTATVRDSGGPPPPPPRTGPLALPPFPEAAGPTAPSSPSPVLSPQADAEAWKCAKRLSE
jgi:hypothetical protein